MRLRNGLLAAIAMTVAAAPVQALVSSSVHPYDDLENLQYVGTHYEGYLYSPSVIVVCVPNPNFWLWPPAPESPRCLAAHANIVGEVTIQADIVHGWRRATGYCMTSGTQQSYDMPITATGPLERHHTVCRSPQYGRSAFAVECTTVCHSLKFGPSIAVFDHLVFQGVFRP